MYMIYLHIFFYTIHLTESNFLTSFSCFHDIRDFLLAQNPSIMGSALRGKNLLQKEQILSFKSWPLFRREAKNENVRVTVKVYIHHKQNTYKYRLDNCSEQSQSLTRVLALHAGSRGFDSHRGHMSERFFRSNRPGYPHPVSSELEKVVSEWRSVIAVSLNVGGGVRLIKPAKLYMCTQNTTNTTRTDARRRVCAAMVPYR